MPPTMTRATPPTAPARPVRSAAGWLGVGAAALALAVGAGEVLGPPATVDLVVRNESGRAVTVVVSSGDGLDLPVATVDPGEERPVDEVLDQGHEWTVSYRVAGAALSEQVITRPDLAGQGFRLTVPAGLGG